MNVRSPMVAVAIIATSFGGAVWAQTYKCKDEKGRTTYSDTPCQGTSRSVVSTQPNSAGSAGADVDRQLRNVESLNSRIDANAPETGNESRASSPRSAMSKAERAERIRSLELDAGRMGLTAKQRQAATREANRLRAEEQGELSSSDRAERIRNAEMEAGRLGNTREQRRAAQAEVDRLKSLD